MITTAFFIEKEIGQFEYNEMLDQYQVSINRYDILEIESSVDSKEEAEQLLKNQVPKAFQNEVKFVSLDSMRKEANLILQNMNKIV